ncbi:MAG TPA: hypothetical protein VHO49_16575 [Anaerolineales bacterium]|nr:hypothetical protein [Anaerolineales bacterium]
MNLNLFEFSEEDLQVNRSGRVSAAQKKWLAGMGQGVRRMSQFNARIGLGFLLFGSCLIFALWMSNEDSRRAFFANPINLFVLPVAALIVIGILGLSIFFAGRLANRLFSPKLQAAEGRVRVEEASTENAGGTYYQIYVGRKKFTFAENVNGIFQEGVKYRVYYVKEGIMEFVLSYETP